MKHKIYFFLFLVSMLTSNMLGAIQPSMYFRSNWSNKTAMTRVTLPDNTNSYVISWPYASIGATTNQWYKMEVTGNYTTNQTWGYGSAPAFNTSTTIPVNGANGLMTATSGNTYFFSIKDVANSTASVGFVFALGGTPVTISSINASSASPGTAVTVTATLSGSVVTNQTVWLRYSVGSSTYATSTITQMTGSGTSYTATIPGQTVGTVVYYYCFTSGTVAGGGGVTTSNVTQATINTSVTTNSYTVAAAQSLTVSPSTLTGFSYWPGSGPSASQSYTLSGQYLDNPGVVTITAPTDYEISKDNSTFVSTDTVAITSATLSARTIYVRLKTGLSSGSYNSESISNAGGGAAAMNVICSGSVLKYAPASQATGLGASNGSPSSTVIHLVWTDAPSTDGYLIRGSSIGYGNISDPVDGTAVSDGGLDKNIASGVQQADITGLSQGTTYYFKVYVYNNTGSNIRYNVSEAPTGSASTTVSTYYSKSGANLEQLSSWGANSDGSGNAPVNFTSDGMTYIITANGTLGGAWTVTGSTTKIQVGDGTAAVNFTVAGSLSATNLDIMNNATVTLGSNVTLTGAINVNNGGVLNCGSYVVGGTSGVFTLKSGGTLKIGHAQGITTSGTTGNIQTTGTRSYNPAGKYVYVGTAAQVTGNAVPNPLASGGLVQNSNTGGTVTLSQYMSFASGSVFIVDAGAVWSTGSNGPTYNNGCTATINGTYQIEQGGGSYTSGAMAFTYGTNGALVINYTSSKLGVYNNNPYWNNNTGYVALPPNVNIKGAGGVSVQTSANMTVGGTFQTSGPVEILYYGSGITMNGTCQINAGGSFTCPSSSAYVPTFGTNSTLVYNQGTSSMRTKEWSTRTSGTGYPANVRISNNTTLALGDTAAQCSGSLTVDAGSALTTTSNILTVNGNIAINGTVNLSGDVKVKGNWTKTGSLNAGSRTVTFNGTMQQTIAGGSTFGNLEVNNENGILIGGVADETIQNNLLLTSGTITLGSSSLILSGSITGTPGTANMIVTSGTGELKKLISSTPVSFTFPVGTENGYTPLQLSLASGSASSAVVGVRTGGVKSGNNTSTSNYLNRTWIISGEGITEPVYDVSAIYLDGDISGDESALTGGFFNGSAWTSLGSVDAVNNAVTGQNLTLFGEITAGEPAAMGAASGAGHVTVSVIPQGYYNSGNFLNMTDTILVCLANDSSPYAIVDSTNALLDSISFAASADFNAATSGSYYLVIKHRNSIETWSASPVSFAKGTTITYDFTAAQSKAYGNNLVQVSSSPELWAIYSGDCNQDGYVDPLDLSLVDQDSYNYVAGTSLTTDVNGDRYVDPLDLSIVDQNSYNYVGIQRPSALKTTRAQIRKIEFKLAGSVKEVQINK